MTLVLNFFLQGLLHKLLENVASVAVILHMFLTKLNYPVEMMNFFAILFPLITFDALPVIGSFYVDISGFETNSRKHKLFNLIFLRIPKLRSLFFSSYLPNGRADYRPLKRSSTLKKSPRIMPLTISSIQ